MARGLQQEPYGALTDMTTDLTTMTAADIERLPSFRARLESSASEGGTLFLSGNFDGYELDQIRDKALYGVDAVRINVDGVARGEAERSLAAHLGPLMRRGVKIYLSV